MNVSIATDHRGIELKKKIIENFKNIEFNDLSKDNYDTDDYPDFAFRVGEDVINNKRNFGILLCGTGIGMSIAANKVNGIRCALIRDENDARFAKEHNDANIIAFGSNMEISKIIEYINIYMNTEVSKDEKHRRRINKIINYEKGTYNGL